MGLKHRHSYESLVNKLLELENSEFKYNTSGKLNLALIYPNLYSLGMSNLGFQTVFKIASSVPGIGVERFFPALEPGIPSPPPFYSFETKRPLGDFDILAFSFSFEGDFDKIPLILGALGIPIKASERNKFHPFLMAGGAAVASNPVALSNIFDVLVPGEAETTLVPILSSFLENGLNIENLINIPGVWVPKSSATPGNPTLPCDVNTDPAYSYVVTQKNTFGGAQLIEIMRGCPRVCAFCLARVIYSPPRPVHVSVISEWLNRHSECTDIGLVAPSLFDHPQIEEILELFTSKGIRVRNSSVKWEKLTPKVLKLLSLSDVKSITLAPETGSKRLQSLMGKPMDTNRFISTVDKIFDSGFSHIKLYFMAGIPTETIEDLDETIDFIAKIYECVKTRSLSASITFSGFISKNNTQWQNKNSCSAGEIKTKFRYIKKGLKRYSDYLKINFESVQEFARQSLLAKIGPELADEYCVEAIKWRENRLFSKKQFVELDF